MKLSSQKTIIFETEIIKLCIKQETLGLEDRINRIENAIKTGDIQKNKVQVQSNQKVQNKTDKITQKVEIQEDNIKSKETQTEEKKQIVSHKVCNQRNTTSWQNILNDLKKQGKVILYANLVNTEAVEINDMTVVIKFYNGLNSFREKILKQPENMNILTKEISMMCGKTMQIKFEDASEMKQSNDKKSSKPEIIEEKIIEETNKENDEEDLLNSLNIPINIIDE